MNALRELFRQFGSLFRWWYVVAPWEQSVRVRLGKRVDVLGAGVHLKIPFIDIVYRQSVRRRFSVIPVQTLTTLDHRCLTIAGRLGYTISNIGTLYDTLHHAEDVICSEVMGLIADFVVTRPLVAPAEIVYHVTSHLNLSRYGISNTEFFVTDFAAVKTYRLLQGEIKDWASGDSLNTACADRADE